MESWIAKITPWFLLVITKSLLLSHKGAGCGGFTVKKDIHIQLDSSALKKISQTNKIVYVLRHFAKTIKVVLVLMVRLWEVRRYTLKISGTNLKVNNLQLFSLLNAGFGMV